MVRLRPIVFNSEKQALYNCEANNVGACIMNGLIVYACQVLVDKQLN